MIGDGMRGGAGWGCGAGGGGAEKGLSEDARTEGMPAAKPAIVLYRQGGPNVPIEKLRDSENDTTQPPVIGITTDVAVVGAGEPGAAPRLRAVGAMTYVDAVTAAGGLAVLLPPVAAQAGEYARLCDGLVMTGGDDAAMEAFGGVTHPKATPMHPARQAFEMALLAAIDAEHAACAERAPRLLGVCLGMQMMTLHNGGVMNQCLAETLATHREHVKDFAHEVRPTEAGRGVGWIAAGGGRVASNHRQGVTDPGRLRVLGLAGDGLIEAVDDPARAFYVGVQWHPERTADRAMGAAIFERLIAAARERMAMRGR